MEAQEEALASGAIGSRPGARIGSGHWQGDPACGPTAARPTPFAPGGRGWYSLAVILSEKIVLLAFLAVVAGVFVTAASLLVRDLVGLLRGRSGPRSRKHIWLRRIVLPLAGVGVLCGAYARFIEPYWLEITHVRIETDELAGATRPVRIVHISDLHCDPKERLEGRLPEVIAGLEPDLIVFTGDAVNSTDALDIFRRCMTRLAQIAPTYAVLGNWDSWPGSSAALFDGTGVRELDDQAVTVEAAGAAVWLAGCRPAGEEAVARLLRTAPPDAHTILLYHYPDEIYRAANEHVDLYLTGHAHGGQVALPFYGAMITLSRYGKRFEAGLYRERDTWMYVSRGVGMEGGPAPRVRFLARPEVTLIEIAPAASAGNGSNP